MAYECQNFKPGQILTAGCMNNIDEWLEYICGKEITKVSTNELGQLEITFCNGEVLNCGVVGVTVEHIEESVKDGGKNIIRFSDGTEVVVRNGNKGTSGVHFGADAPPSNATIWINPNGEPTSIENWEFDLEDGNTEAKTVVVLGSNDSTDSDKLPLLKVKDENGNWVEIPAIKGFDPIVETSKSGKVSTIRITTSDGVKTVTVNDGFDPKVTVSKSGKVTTVKITDASGTKTATINDGVDITKVEQTTASSEDGGSNVMTVTLSNGNKSTFTVKNGKQGTSVTVASVSESTEAGGSNVVQFSDGKSLTVKNGSDANVTANNVKAALGFTPANNADLSKKADDFSLEINNNAAGTPAALKFATIDYSTCPDSNNGISVLVSMRSGHGNGKSFIFLQDAYIHVTYDGIVRVDNHKHYDSYAGKVDEVHRDYGDIFWVIDTDNKIVDFYCLVGQWVRLHMTPWKRLTNVTSGTFIQHTTRTIYSEGEKVWANNANIALTSDIPSVPTKTDTWTATYEDGTVETIEVYVK